MLNCLVNGTGLRCDSGRFECESERLAITRFYLRTTEGTLTGPYTGLELRAAAMARLVVPETEVARAADGPWIGAVDAGLFVGNNIPLPHPHGTALPEFRATRVGDAFESTLSLQELIDLAVRKELSADAVIQPVGHRDSIPVNHFPILNACLQGELSRTLASDAIPVASPNAAQHDGDKPPVTKTVHNADLLAAPEDDIDLILSDHRDRVQQNVRDRISSRSKNSKFQFKTSYAGWLVVPLLVGLLAWWLMQPQGPRTDLSEAIGDWVLIPTQNEGTAFGISFREDGTCVVFNSNGDCWSGDFQWFDDAETEASVQSFGPIDDEVADIPSHHHRFPVQPSDGLVRLDGGSSRNPPMLEGKSIGECFLRQDGAYLWLGYFLGAGQTSDGNSLKVGWVSLWPRRRPIRSGALKIDLPIQATKLLSRHGVPDEARPIDPMEVTANSHSGSSEPRSVVRYGTTQLTVFADSSVRRFKTP